MLEQLRNASERPWAKILMGVLIFSFVGWGVAEYIFGNSATDDTVISVAGTDVKMAQFENERNRALAGLSKDQQKQIFTDKAQMSAFSAGILQQIASQTMLQLRADDLGLTVTDGQIAAQIRNEPAFQVAGAFSSDMFSAVIAQSGLTEDGFANSIRAGMLRDMLLSSVAGLPMVPNFAIDATYIARNKSRDIEYARVAFADMKTPAAPTEQNLRDTFAKNPKIIPETRDVSYVLVPAKMSAPDDYDRGYEKMTGVEDDIIGGTDMNVSAKNHGAKFVRVNGLTADKKSSDPIITDKIMTELFNTEEGNETEVTETPAGFAIFRVESARPAHAVPYEQRTDELKKLYVRDAQKASAYIRANEILKSANSDGKAIGKTTSVSRTSGAPLDVLTAAFANPVGTKTIVPANDAYYVLNVKSSVIPKIDATKRKALATDIAKNIAQGMVDDYSRFLSDEYRVKINQKLLDRMLGK